MKNKTEELLRVKVWIKKQHEFKLMVDNTLPAGGRVALKLTRTPHHPAQWRPCSPAHSYWPSSTLQSCKTAKQILIRFTQHLIVTRFANLTRMPARLSKKINIYTYTFSCNSNPKASALAAISFVFPPEMHHPILKGFCSYMSLAVPWSSVIKVC